MSRKKQVYTPSIEPSYSKKAIWSWLGLVVAAIGVVQLQEIVSFVSEAISTDAPVQLPRLSRREANDAAGTVGDRADAARNPAENATSSEPTTTDIAPEAIQPIEFSQESQQTILDNYQNLMHAFVVEENLKELEASHPLRIAANERTVATLNQLEGAYRQRLLKFLIDSNLILGENPTLSLKGATFSSADLSDFQLSNIDLHGAKFSDTRLNRANLADTRLTETNFDRADLSFADLNGAALTSSSLQNANLFLTNVSHTDLQGANLTASDLFLTNFQNANLSNAHITAADLSYANLSNAQLVFTNFSDANLSFTNLSEARLTGADFNRSILRGANLRNADLGGANLRNADLSGADLSGANLTGANLTGAVFYNTVMPDGNVRY
jgi:uncharacterized protein YjbI with pentapeptide repeats